MFLTSDWRESAVLLVPPDGIVEVERQRRGGLRGVGFDGIDVHRLGIIDAG